MSLPVPLEWRPDRRGNYSIIPEHKKRFHPSKEHKYQVWSDDQVFDIPVMIAEFEAPSDRVARRSVADVLALKYGEGESYEKMKAHFFLKFHRKDLHLKNAHTGKEIKMMQHRIQPRDIERLAKVS